LCSKEGPWPSMQNGNSKGWTWGGGGGGGGGGGISECRSLKQMHIVTTNASSKKVYMQDQSFSY